MYKNRWFWGLLLPSLIVFTMIIVIPTVTGIALSFTDWESGKTLYENGWVGFDNYKQAFEGGAFGSAIWYTLVFTIVTMIMVNVIGFGLAYLLTKPFKGKSFFRGAFFLPNLIGGLVLGFIWQQIFDRAFLDLFSLSESWRIESRWSAMMSLSLTVSWQMSGYVMVIYIASLQNVPQNLIEASKIEGAGPLKRFASVVLPSVMPAITVAMFLTISNSFKMFDLNLSLTDGFFEDRNLLALDIYKSAFGSSSVRLTYGIAQAKSVIFTLLVSAITLTQVSITKRLEVEA